MKNSIQKNTITLFIILIVVVIINIGFYFLTMSQYGQMQSNITQSRMAQQENSELTKLGSEIKTIREDLKRLSTRIIASDGDVAFIENIEKLARSQGASISVDDVKYEDMPGQENIQYLKVVAVVEGDWKNVYSALKLIETMPYKLEFKSVFLNFNTTTKKAGVWSASISLRAYKMK